MTYRTTFAVLTTLTTVLGVNDNAIAQQFAPAQNQAQQYQVRQNQTQQNQARPYQPTQQQQAAQHRGVQNGAVQNQGQQARPTVQPQFPQKSARQPLRPAWFPLNEQNAAYTKRVLDAWEKQSNGIQKYKCDFTRWEYDPVFYPLKDAKGAWQPYEVTSGEIRYESPDKGLFKANSLQRYDNAQKKYLKAAESSLEHWVCSGKSLFSFDYRAKKLTETQLPPQMQGQAIANGPLPFLFKANADQIQSRYWVRAFVHEKNYWLEAWPKRADDAAEYKYIHVIVDPEKFLPTGIVVYKTNWTQQNPAKTSYQFANREVNAANLLGWLKNDFDPATPSGWQKHVERAAAPQGPHPQGPAQQAQRPAGTFRN